jgi:hypothetical protein
MRRKNACCYLQLLIEEQIPLTKSDEAGPQEEKRSSSIIFRISDEIEYSFSVLDLIKYKSELDKTRMHLFKK